MPVTITRKDQKRDPRGARPSFDPEKLRPLLHGKTLQEVGTDHGVTREAMRLQAKAHGLVAVSFWGTRAVRDEITVTGDLRSVRRWRVDHLPENLQTPAIELAAGLSIETVAKRNRRCPNRLSQKLRGQGMLHITTHASEKDAKAFFSKIAKGRVTA